VTPQDVYTLVTAYETGEPPPFEWTLRCAPDGDFAGAATRTYVDLDAYDPETSDTLVNLLVLCGETWCAQLQYELCGVERARSAADTVAWFKRHMTDPLSIAGIARIYLEEIRNKYGDERWIVVVLNARAPVVYKAAVRRSFARWSPG